MCSLFPNHSGLSIHTTMLPRKPLACFACLYPRLIASFCSAYMASLGHNVTWVAPGQSVVQGITRGLNGVSTQQLDGGGLSDAFV